MEDKRCTVVSHTELMPQREFHCQLCFGKVYKIRARYKGHLKRIHHITTEPDNRLFNCYHCPCSECRFHKHAPGVIAFCEISQLRRHYQRHHMDQNTICPKDRASPKEPEAVDQQHANHEDDKENKSRPIERQMKKCPECKKKYFFRHRCFKHPCQKCGRVFYCKSALEFHMKKSTHSLRVEDKIFVDEILQLLSSIEDGTVRDPPLLKAFAEILPVLKKIQEP
ncbi:zinc finger protein 11 [Drosophila serrata]|uniref:zinc finger protein 11 n=1 Tax=Drosophila serrata TaxID=7274 RepID=UPI000A1D2A35|nr:zinc finger protein 11 [Drosophila serrata]